MRVQYFSNIFIAETLNDSNPIVTKTIDSLLFRSVFQFICARLFPTLGQSSSSILSHGSNSLCVQHLRLFLFLCAGFFEPFFFTLTWRNPLSSCVSSASRTFFNCSAFCASLATLLLVRLCLCVGESKHERKESLDTHEMVSRNESNNRQLRNSGEEFIPQNCKKKTRIGKVNSFLMGMNPPACRKRCATNNIEYSCIQ